MLVWSLPKVFHTCGKNCGKSLRSITLPGFEAEFPRLLVDQAPQPPANTTFVSYPVRSQLEHRP